MRGVKTTSSSFTYFNERIYDGSFSRSKLFFEGIKHLCFKRPQGARWVEHQRDALKAHLHNFVVLIGFCNNQIISPHNDFIKKIVSQLEGIKIDAGVILHVIFDTIKFDVLGVIEVIIKVLQEADHLLPSLLSLCHRGLQQIRKLVHLTDKNGKEIFYRNDLFLTVADIIERIKDEEEDIVPERQTRASAAATDGHHCFLNDYLLTL